MVTVRARQTGSFDHKAKCWRLRGKGIHATVGQLARRYGVEFRSETPAQLERESAPYWNRYRQEVEDADWKARKAVSPLQRRIQSIEAAIGRLKAESRSTADLDKLIVEAAAVPPHDVDHHDLPIVPPDLPPDVAAFVTLSGLDTADELVTGLLNQMVATKPTPKQRNGIKQEAEAYIARHKARGHKGWFQVRQAVNLLTDVTGDVPPADVTVHDWRQAYANIEGCKSWGGTTRSNMQRIIIDFLEKVAADHNITTYGFLNNKDHLFRRPKGKKERYTVEQVKTALQHATGDVRTALLLGLNCGSYIGDIATLTRDMVKDNHLVRSRDKLKHKTDPVIGSWLLWKETQACLRYGIKARRIQEQYSAFAKEHGLPPHKALRKTTAQAIHDHVRDGEAARLFRGESLPGTHGANYISDFTAQQVEQLDAALRKVGELYGVG